MNSNFVLYGNYRGECKFNEKEINILNDMKKDIEQYPSSTFDIYDKDNKYIFVKDVSENVNGVLVFEDYGDSFFLAKIYVEPLDRRQGLATAMLNRLIGITKGKPLNFGIHESNKSSLDFFKEHGESKHVCIMFQVN